MFGPPGCAYVYTIHTRYCLNVVCEGVGVGAAILIRAIEPESGYALMQKHRRTDKPLDWTRGPGRLCEALAIDLSWDSWDLTLGQGLWIERGPKLPPFEIAVSPRIGINSAVDLPLRYFVRGHRFVSGPRRWHELPRTTLTWVSGDRAEEFRHESPVRD
jgi:DNA-3-methyladenine glycosylase